ncbi:MAG: hypothetical protein K8T26_11405 [Lentisphaerae bacterium]|nr:hypothetical protein [Lentisphaerota bacterium]
MGAKQIHDQYGKAVLRKAFGNAFNDSPDPVPFGENAGSVKIDGTIGDDVAVEVESRASKQVRGAIVDIIWHPFPKKLVVLIKKYGNNYTAEQCRVLLRKFAPTTCAKVVSLNGNGSNQLFDEDVAVVKDAVTELRRAKP